MHFTMSLHELDKHVSATLSALQASLGLYEKEGIDDAALRTTLTDIQAHLGALRDSLADTVAAHGGRFEMIRYLNAALQMEYVNILDYERYVAAVEDDRLAMKLQEFGRAEWTHAHALAAKITDLGGRPHFTVSHEEHPDVTVFDLLRQHYETEGAVIAYYEQGLGKFDDAAFRWLIGKIKVEEEEHRDALEALLEEYRDTDLLVQESRALRWVDPYMGKPGDRAWIE